jgi:hypothetical protein
MAMIDENTDLQIWRTLDAFNELVVSIAESGHAFRMNALDYMERSIRERLYRLKLIDTTKTPPDTCVEITADDLDWDWGKTNGGKLLLRSVNKFLMSIDMLAAIDIDLTIEDVYVPVVVLKPRQVNRTWEFKARFLLEDFMFGTSVAVNYMLHLGAANVYVQKVTHMPVAATAAANYFLDSVLGHGITTNV